MILRWFTSKTVRHAVAMRKHVHRILSAQRDILSPQAVEAVSGALGEFQTTLRSGADKTGIKAQMENLETVANKWLKPYPNAAWRENVEVFLVALAVAMAIRTFFLQPFKIPTGSMQPTLFGVTDENLIDRPDFKIPTGWEAFKEWTRGISYVHVVAENDGPLLAVQPPTKLLIFGIRQQLRIGNHWQSIWFPPDYGSPPTGTLEARAGLRRGMDYRKGEDVAKLQINAGDYLFVDRLTFNFRKPHRGEIIVFETRGIEETARIHPGRWEIPDDQFYIKRLVALSGESVKIGDDQHLIIDGKRLDSSTPGFENVYSFDPAKENNEYFGHIPTEKFAAASAGVPFQVRSNHFMVMGDNTRSSLDSRYFGDVDANYIIGKSWFVYWPLTSRFGFGYR